MTGDSNSGLPPGMADAEQPRERRTTHRAAIEIPAMLHVGGRRVACTVRDLSTTGISLATREILAPGMVVRVVFQLPNTRLPLEISGCLVRQAGGRLGSTVGIQFIDPDRDALRAIQSFVSRNRSDRPFSRRPTGPDTGEFENSAEAAELRSLYRRAVDEVADKPGRKRGLLDRLLRRRH